MSGRFLRHTGSHGWRVAHKYSHTIGARRGERGTRFEGRL